MKSTRSQTGGSPQAFWNVLLLGVHMAFHSAHETLDCLAMAGTESTGNTMLQTFSFNEVSKLIMAPWLVLTGWFPTWRSRASPAPDHRQGRDPIPATLVARCSLPVCHWGQANLILCLKNVTICLGLRINLLKMKIKAGNTYNRLAFGVKLPPKKSILTLF